MKNIVVLDGYAANPGDISWDELSALGSLTVYDRTSPEETVERARGAEIILTNKVIIGESEISQLPDLRYVGVLATGYNVVDIEAARRHGVVVTNIPAYSTASVAQMVFAHLLNITHHVAHHADEVRKGRWQTSPDFCFYDTPLLELEGQTLSVVGLGNTGMAVARIALSFGMKVLAWTSKSQDSLPSGIEKAVSLDELFSKADVLSLHCPLTPDTHHLVNASRLSLMKPSAIVINTGRGPLVDDEALADALNSAKIYAAGIDVLTQEPPRDGNPLIAARNCFITPHIAWASLAARRRLLHIAACNVEAFISGTPVNVVS
ncbi:MAG: D-2-hydroxyacid dehydrogenase [Bacteroidales bacterium]|nr:D-2-hydroxyacid dehydrogenase [Candidatus Liminaster caballi]